MTRVLVDDPDLATRLMAARTSVEVCDASGLILGHFVPQVMEEGAPGHAGTSLHHGPEVDRSGAVVAAGDMLDHRVGGVAGETATPPTETTSASPSVTSFFSPVSTLATKIAR